MRFRACHSALASYLALSPGLRLAQTVEVAYPLSLPFYPLPFLPPLAIVQGQNGSDLHLGEGKEGERESGARDGACGADGGGRNETRGRGLMGKQRKSCAGGW